MIERSELFINGEWTRPVDGEVTDVVEAATEDVIGRVALAGPADVDRAVAAAEEAGRGEWGSLSDNDRADRIEAFADSVKSRAKQTAELVSRQNGMPIKLSTGANGHLPAILLNYYAGLIRDRQDDVRPGVGGTRTLVRAMPIGVVGTITPWNYPQALAAMKLAPALAAGCSIVLKPPPETALDAFTFAEAALEANLPAGVINIVPGGREAGARLAAHPGVAKIAFTGSTAAGRAIGAECGRLLKPVTLELGGKSAAILTEDVDLQQYLTALPRVSLPNSGQTCHSSTRILAPRSRYGEIVDAITDTVSGLRIGNPLERETQIGPMVSAAQRERVLDYIAIGKGEGARLTTGGSRPFDSDRGWFVEPTVFADVDNTMRIAREEIFGPVLCVIPYSDEDEAVAIANDSDYGLAGTIWTADEQHGVELSRRIHTGSIGVNHYGLDPAAPFGGVKASGYGRELGPEGLAPYISTQSVYLPAG
ncbi:aldehyde dehydrogenase [Gordonia sp. DT30]|uniref:aldehyde dehydrogenase n=1 Tax=Gordonia sp. DT30 TaxID=3416546 RepID=UPI003CE6DC56